MPKTSYPSKVLLFGEYAVMCGGQGLAVPYPAYSAKWIKEDGEKENKKHLQNFLQYLLQNGFSNRLDLQRFADDLKNGFTIISDIPVGYGLGSSGAVVAAVYDRYALPGSYVNDLSQLKTFLGSMEDFFHRKSSGLDPLICLIGTAVQLKENGVIHELASSAISGNIPFTLTDTGINRSTETFVQIFNQKMQDDEFRNAITHKYLPMVADCIRFYLRDKADQFYHALSALAEFQFIYFDFAIPHPFKAVWQASLEGGQAIYKLCGAGGGGCMLRFERPGGIF